MNKRVILILVVAALVYFLFLRQPAAPARSSFDPLAGIQSLANSLSRMFSPGGVGGVGGPPALVTTSTGNAFEQGSAFGFDPETGAPGMSGFASPIGPVFQG
jgi:hypothetical protein